MICLKLSLNLLFLLFSYLKKFDEIAMLVIVCIVAAKRDYSIVICSKYHEKMNIIKAEFPYVQVVLIYYTFSKNFCQFLIQLSEIFEKQSKTMYQTNNNQFFLYLIYFILYS